MTTPRRKLHHLVCAQCTTPFDCERPKQRCCSISCGAAYSYAHSRARKDAWWKASVATRRPRNLARLRQQLAHCETKGDAFRLGFSKGWRQGWQTRDRRVRWAS